mgnify:CR=1 FL=1
MKIDEKHISGWVEHKAEGRAAFNRYEASVEEELEKEGLSPEEIESYLDTLEAAASKKQKTAKDPTSMTDEEAAAFTAGNIKQQQMAVLHDIRPYFLYGKKGALRANILQDVALKSRLITVTTEAKESPKEAKAAIDKFKAQAEGQTQKDNAEKLANKLAEVIERKVKRIHKPIMGQNKKTIGDFLGKPNLKDLKTREEIYDYWEEVAQYYDEVIEKGKAFSKLLYKDTYDDILEGKVDEAHQKFNGALSSLKPYVVEIEAVPYQLDSQEERVWMLMAGFLKLAGVTQSIEPKGRKDEKPEEEDLREAGKAKEGEKASEFRADLQPIAGGEAGKDTPEEEHEREERAFEEGISEAETQDWKDVLSDSKGGSAEGWGAEEWASSGGSVDIEAARQESAKDHKLQFIQLGSGRANLVEVDPLFYYYFKTSSGLDNIPITNKEAEDMAEDIRDMGWAINLNDNLRTGLDNYIANLEKEISSAQGDSFMVPLTPFFETGKTKQDKKENDADLPEWVDSKYKQVTEATATFLESVAKLIEVKRTQFGTAGRGGRARVQTKLDFLSNRIASGLFAATPSEAAKGTKREWSNELETALNELINAIIDYYVEPLESGKFPGEKPRWMSQEGSAKYSTKVISLYSEDDSSELEERWLKYGAAAVTASDINSLKEFIERIAVKSSIEYDTSLIEQAEDAVDAMTAMFGPKTRKLNEHWVGAALHRVANGLKMDINELEFEGETLKAHYKEKKNKRRWPMNRFGEWLETHQDELEHPKALKTAVDKFLTMLDKINKSSEIQEGLLEAHDMIRKMTDKETYYGRASLSNADELDKVITKIQITHGVDIAVTELTDIVEKIDSMKAIAREHGITEDVVYMAKAMCR